MRGKLVQVLSTVALLATVGVTTVAGSVVSAPEVAAATPTPTAARTGPPTNIYAIGDSITTATGTDTLGAEVPANSWVTGSNSAVVSMRQRLGITNANAVNLAANGERIEHFDDQANELPAGAQFVVVALGGNDLCRPSVAEMTSVATYRAQVRAGLAAVANRAPNALIFVASIPDIYNLWYIRGAPSSINPHVADQTGQAGQARLYWGTLGVIPCQSLVDNPESTATADVNRRLQVRNHNLALNQVLAEECGAVLRCRYDGNLLFNRSSNRVNPPNGPVGARSTWWFEDDDISHNDGGWSFLCPLPGLLSGGTTCGDHFHPSLRGQGKLAQAGHEASYQFQSDQTAPTRTATVSRPPDGDGVYARSVDVTFGGTDAAGLRGQEVRVHQPDGSVGPWQQHLGVAPPVTVSAVGTSHVEVRSLDVNGNLSASLIQSVTIQPSAFGTVAGTVTGPGGPVEGAEVRLHAADTEAVLATDVTGADGAYAFADQVVSRAYKVEVVDPSGVHLAAWHGGATSHGAATAVTPPAAGTVTADVALALTPGTVAGTVTGPSGPLDGITVEVHGAAVEGVITSTTTDDAGTYTLDVVPGDRRVRFVDPTGTHAGEWHADAATHAGATTVAVTRSTTTTVDAVLEVVPGAVAGTVNGPAGPVEGLQVVATPAGTEAAGEPVTTGADGGYVIDGLLPGAHEVSVAPVACTWAATTATVDVPTAGGTATLDLTVAEAPPGPHGLSDVPVELDAAVSWLVDACNTPRYLKPSAAGTFRPTAAMTRGQAVRSLWVIEGRPAVSRNHGLRGVPRSLAPAVRWAVAAGHLTGRPDGTFGATAAITRGDLARFVHRLEAPGAIGTGHGLTDVPRRVEQAVRWLTAEGVAEASGTRFRPNRGATRATFAHWSHLLAD